MNQLSFLKKRSPIHGLGMFAMSSIPKGTIFYSFIPIIVSQKPLPKFARVSEKIFVSDEILDFVNHSCAPNTKIVFEKGVVQLVAIAEIPVSGEIVVDYTATEEKNIKITCTCLSKACRGYFFIT